jgi:hypothetical protein
MKILIAAIVLFLTAFAHAVANDRFVSKLTLQNGKTVVVVEGDFEARSLGSYSMRLYDAADAPDETTFFTSGIIRARDGAIEKVVLADINGDKQQEIIVIARSVGTGGYLSAQAFAVIKNKLIFRASVKELAADADPIAALRKSNKPIKRAKN